MKNIKISFLFCWVLFVGLTVSCYKDDSQLDTNKITTISIDTTGMSTLSVRQFDNLQIQPNLEIGTLNPSDLTYEWRLNFEPKDDFFEVVGTEKDLDYQVRLPPNRSGEYHIIYYKVIDNNTGLEYSVAWPLTIQNNIGEGLVVAVSPDGIHTDISHIMAPEVTPDYTEVSVKHGVYSAINNQMLEGLVKQMRFTTIYGVDALMAITDEDIYRVNTLDYTYEGKNDDLFFSSKPDYQPQSLGAIVQGDVYVGEGKLTATYLGASRKFGLPFDFDYQVPAELAYNGFTYYPLPVRFNFYDEQNEHFVYLPTIMFGDTNMHPVPADTDGVFNPMEVLNKENIAASVSTTGDFRHLLKDKTTGALELYVLDGGGDQYPSPIPPAPKSFYSLAGAPEINQAKFFVFLVDQRVMYYATETKIYAMLYSTETPSFEERYTVPAGQTISTLQLYQQSGYPDKNSSNNISTNNKQLVLSTYDGAEGRVSLLPITNIGVGNIDESQIKTFDGFDKVIAITSQK